MNRRNFFAFLASIPGLSLLLGKPAQAAQQDEPVTFAPLYWSKDAVEMVKNWDHDLIESLKAEIDELRKYAVKWIPVSEALPECDTPFGSIPSCFGILLHSRKVLVSTPSGVYIDQRWKFEDGSEQFGHEATHWAELPAGPGFDLTSVEVVLEQEPQGLDLTKPVPPMVNYSFTYKPPKAT